MKNMKTGDMAGIGNVRHPLHTAPLPKGHGQKAGSAGMAHLTGMKPLAKAPGMRGGMPKSPSGLGEMGGDTDMGY